MNEGEHNDGGDRATIGMANGSPVNDYKSSNYKDDECGIDLLEPYCNSDCPEDCISGHWESVHPQGSNEGGIGYEVIASNNNMITIIMYYVHNDNNLPATPLPLTQRET